MGHQFIKLVMDAEKSLSLMNERVLGEMSFFSEQKTSNGQNRKGQVLVEFLWGKSKNWSSEKL